MTDALKIIREAADAAMALTEKPATRDVWLSRGFGESVDFWFTKPRPAARYWFRPNQRADGDLSVDMLDAMGIPIPQKGELLKVTYQRLRTDGGALGQIAYSGCVSSVVGKLEEKT